MFGIHNYTSFVLAIIAFQIIPGPGTLAILSATARHGIRSGMGAVFGTLAGDLLFMLAAVLGLAAVLMGTPGYLTLVAVGGHCLSVLVGLKAAPRNRCRRQSGFGEGAESLDMFSTSVRCLPDQPESHHVLHGIFSIVSCH